MVNSKTREWSDRYFEFWGKLRYLLVVPVQVSFFWVVVVVCWVAVSDSLSLAPYCITTRPITTREAPHHHTRDTDSSNKNIPNSACTN